MLVGYRHPEDDRDAFDDDGFFRTGDLGRWVDDDYLVVTGRAKDIIIRNGENISPKEIEDILVGHPGIARSRSSACPTTRTGERACAVIVRHRPRPAPTSPTCATSSPTTASPSSKFLSRWSSGTRCRRTTRERCSSIRSGRHSKVDERYDGIWVADMQVAIVTGASSGIGFGCATKLAEAGMAVLGTGRDEDRLAELEKAIGDPDRVATIAVDLTADDAPRRIVDAAVQRWGHIDFLVNNAGVGSPKPLHETDDDSLDYFLGLMLRAPFRLARDVIPHMAPGLGDHQHHVDLRRRRRSAWRRVLGGQGRPDRADHCTSPASTARRESGATQSRRASR